MSQKLSVRFVISQVIASGTFHGVSEYVMHFFKVPIVLIKEQCAGMAVLFEEVRTGLCKNRLYTGAHTPALYGKP